MHRAPLFNAILLLTFSSKNSKERTNGCYYLLLKEIYGVCRYP